MSKTREIKRRLRSVEKTRQITRTMEMVATSKLKKMTDLVHAARPYSVRLEEVISRLTDPELRARYPLLRKPETDARAAVILLTSNRGLAGAFNVNLIREARQLLDRLEAEGVEVDLHVAGKKGIAFFRFQKRAMVSMRTDIPDRREPEHAASLVDGPMKAFEAGSWTPSTWSTPSSGRRCPRRPASCRCCRWSRRPGPERTRMAEGTYILSPGADEILNQLLPLYVRNRVYRALVETAASEQSSRRTAMKNATDNAGEIIDNLRRTFNRARQAQITQEISEIVGGAAALDGSSGHYTEIENGGKGGARSPGDRAGAGRGVRRGRPAGHLQRPRARDPRPGGRAEARSLVAEVQQHIGRNQVRAVAMSSTDGVVRGMSMKDTGRAIAVPVGEAALGRILNVLGNPVDQMGDIAADVERWPIHRPAPLFTALEPKTEIFETGHQGHRPDRAVREGRQDRPVRRRRRGQDRDHHGAHPQHRHGARRALRVLRRGRADA
jgi:F-type H+-transporting ATPase subunit gamma